jgi:microcystin-dependent protein
VSTPYLGEIRMFGGNFAPAGWEFCDGRILPISQYNTLYSLIGTTYGGDGQQTFGLPNLVSRIPFHQGPARPLGEVAGAESVTLNTNQLPLHSHAARASNAAASSSTPAGNVWAGWGDAPYAADPPDVPMDASAISGVGNGLPHENRPPFMALTFIIALDGIYPSPA